MSARWSPFVKQIVIVGTLAAAIWLLFSVRVMLAPLILALMLSFVVSFPLNWIIRNTGWPRLVVVVGIYLLVIVLIATAPVIVIPRLVSMVSSFAVTLGRILQEVTDATPEPIVILPSLVIDLSVIAEPINQWLRGTLQPSLNDVESWPSLLGPFASSAAVVVRGAVNSVVWIIFILAVSFYVTKDAQKLGRFIAERIPEAFQGEVRRLLAELVAVWDSFVRGQVLLGLTMGVIVWIVAAILGLRNAATLGLLSAVLEFVPGVGPVIAAIPAVLIALILGSTWLPIPNVGFAILVALIYFLLSQFENVYLLPRVLGRRIDLHPVVVIVGALAGAQLAGVLGILLAAPTIASARVVFGYGVHKLMDEEPFPLPESPLDRGVYWQGLLQGRAVGALLFDLDGTLLEADFRVVHRLAQRLSFLSSLFPTMNPERAARWLLMFNELCLNEIVSLLRALRLYRLMAQLNPALLRARGFSDPHEYAAIKGSLETICHLAQHYPIGMISSRSWHETATFLAQYRLSDVFDVIISRDDARRMKAHPLPVLMAAKRMGVRPAQCVVVGDGIVDLRVARAAGALVVGVLSGLGTEADLATADLVIPSVAQLGEWL